ncbi:MAG: hypothetical protein KA716_33150 [Gloeotrichia echinulata DEX184]
MTKKALIAINSSTDNNRSPISVKFKLGKPLTVKARVQLTPPLLVLGIGDWGLGIGDWELGVRSNE